MYVTSINRINKHQKQRNPINTSKSKGKVMKKFAIIIAGLAIQTSVQASSYTMTPEGNYIGGSSYTMTPDGNYVGGSRYSMTPDGNYVGGSRSTLAPDGSYVGGTDYSLTPDGRYVGNGR